MKLHFKISYFTHWGQNMAIIGSLPQLGENDSKKAALMNFQWREDWTYDLEIKSSTPLEFKYKYVLKDVNGIDSHEWGDFRTVKINPNEVNDLYLVDTWNAPSAIENVFMTSPFQDVLFRDNYIAVEAKETKKYTQIFKVKAPMLKHGEALCMVGDAKALGSWDTTKALLMSNTESPWWTAKVDLSKETKNSVSYKFAVYDLEDKCFKYFENGPDRYAEIKHEPKTQSIISASFANFDNKQFHGAG
ncbi:MAG TPA: carbohydrate-binding module family 20 domain-containing protein, partial [Candidatus Enterocola sp.]|nr:carbohydrate-binding module family 20 domain-containing protein [Candidatus Enterocola sp.]